MLTFALMAFNSERFIEEAIKAAFSQTYMPLEIILSDDSSTDRTVEIIRRMAAQYQGPHDIILNFNRRNTGVSGHINRIMEICSGELIVIAAADDISVPERAEKSYDAFVRSGGRALSIHSSVIIIDEKGVELRREQEYDSYAADLESVIENGTWLYGSTHAWHRAIFDTFGPLPPAVRREDEVLPFRSLLLGNIAYIREPLVRNRTHDTNISNAFRRSASNSRELQDQITFKVHERLVNLKCYLTDLETAGDLVDHERKELLRKRLLREIHEHELELSIRKGSPQDKFSALAQGVMDRLGAGPIMKRLIRILFPGAYAQYSFYKYKRDGGGW